MRFVKNTFLKKGDVLYRFYGIDGGCEPYLERFVVERDWSFDLQLKDHYPNMFYVKKEKDPNWRAEDCFCPVTVLDKYGQIHLFPDNQLYPNPYLCLLMAKRTGKVSFEIIEELEAEFLFKNGVV